MAGSGNLPLEMSRNEWKKAIKGLPRGLSYCEAARRLNASSYQAARKWMIALRYKASDGRGTSTVRRDAVIAKFKDANWHKSNVVLSEEYNTSREWIRQVRNILGHDRVESRGKKQRAVFL